MKYQKPAKVKKGEKAIPKIDGDDVDLKEKLKNCRKVDFPFITPSVGAQSFGWRSAGQNGTESALKFLEPYSTHFFGDKTKMFLDSTQVVAVPDGKIGGKIMTLEAEKQILKHAECYRTLKDIIPIVKRYLMLSQALQIQRAVTLL